MLRSLSLHNKMSEQKHQKTDGMQTASTRYHGTTTSINFTTDKDTKDQAIKISRNKLKVLKLANCQ